MVDFTCPACKQRTQALASPGKRTKCKRCGQRVRVPLPDAPQALLTCPECGAETTSSAAPGKTAVCAPCGARFRVPLLDPSLREDAVAAVRERTAPVVRRTCPACGAKVDGRFRRCSECEAVMDEAQYAARYAGAAALADVAESLAAGDDRYATLADVDRVRGVALAEARAERDARPLSERHATRFRWRAFGAALLLLGGGAAWAYEEAPARGPGPKALFTLGALVLSFVLAVPRRVG
ncbi:MAG: hypothetical protein R3F62_10045 [Planctomycetota bacterium]